MTDTTTADSEPGQPLGLGCGGDGMDPMTDYALECPECGGLDLP